MLASEATGRQGHPPACGSQGLPAFCQHGPFGGAWRKRPYVAEPRYLPTAGPPGRRLRPLPCPIPVQTVPRFGTGQDCRCSYASLPASLEALNALQRRLYAPRSAVVERLGRGERTTGTCVLVLPALRRPGHTLYVCLLDAMVLPFRKKQDCSTL